MDLKLRFGGNQQNTNKSNSRSNDYPSSKYLNAIMQSFLECFKIFDNCTTLEIVKRCFLWTYRTE